MVARYYVKKNRKGLPFCEIRFKAKVSRFRGVLGREYTVRSCIIRSADETR